MQCEYWILPEGKVEKEWFLYVVYFMKYRDSFLSIILLDFFSIVVPRPVSLLQPSRPFPYPVTSMRVLLHILTTPILLFSLRK